MTEAVAVKGWEMTLHVPSDMISTLCDSLIGTMVRTVEVGTPARVYVIQPVLGQIWHCEIYRSLL